jgi:hydrogenase expression/formation protein HypC
MCLSIPSKVVEIDEENTVIVDTMGVRRAVSLDLMGEPVRVGEYVLIHVGFAMSKIDEADAVETLNVYREILDTMDAEEKAEGEAGEPPPGESPVQRSDR